MSLEATTRALNTDAPSPAAKLLLIGLASHAHADGTAAWPSVATLAHYVGCSERTVFRHLPALMEAGLIREGDQRLVAHLRPDRRTVVYDVAMDEWTRAEWAAAYAARRGDNLTGRDVDGVTDSTPRGDIPGSHGVTLVSDKPSVEPSVEPSTPYSPPSVPVQEFALISEDDARPVALVPDPDWFGLFWEAYPLKVGKQAARKAFDRAARAAGPQAVLQGLAGQRDALASRERRFVPHPTTWLNQGRWEDDPACVTSGTSGGRNANPFTEAALYGPAGMPGPVVRGEVLP